MRFVLTTRFLAHSAEKGPCALLVKDTWNDYGYTTLYRMTFIDEQGNRLFVGRVKILQRGKEETTVPTSFDELGSDHCSLGDSMDYYAALEKLGDNISREILDALRDVAVHPELLPDFQGEPGFERSLLRFPEAQHALKSAASLFDQTPREPVQALSLTFTSIVFAGFDGPHRVHLTFPEPAGQLGRMAAIIGKNSAGKTLLLDAMAKVISGVDVEKGELSPVHRARVVVFSFSAFDCFTRPRLDDSLGASYRYYGLMRPGSAAGTKGRASVEYAFDRLHDALSSIAGHPDRIALWRRLVDDVGLFRGEALPDPFQVEGVPHFIEEVRHLSSGYQMVVLILSGLVDSIREGSFIFFDEPETHFHPTLLATVLRLLYSVLEQFRAYAIVATHSPVVLQEVPARSVQILFRDGRRPVTRPYRGESFGANLGEIAREAFGAEEEGKSHVSILRELAKERPRNELEALFNGLGVSVRMLLDDLYEDRGAR